MAFNHNDALNTVPKRSFFLGYPLLPYLPAGRCHGDTRVFPGRHRVITGRLSKGGVGAHPAAFGRVTLDRRFSDRPYKAAKQGRGRHGHTGANAILGFNNSNVNRIS